jgi:hypothetical protein
MRGDLSLRRLAVVPAMVLLASCGTTVAGSTTQTAGESQAGLSAPGGSSSTGGGTQSLSVPGATATSSGGAINGAGSSSGATTGGSNTNVGSSAGSAATTGPVRIGFMTTNNDAAASAGVNNGVSFNTQSVMKALVASYNAGGGLAGRKIQAYYQVINSSSNDFEGDLAAACASLTQDDHVAVVINDVGLYSESYQACLADAHVPVVSDLGPDGEDAQKFPLMITPDDLRADTRVVQVVQRLKASGWLTPSNRIGVVVEGCPIDQRIFTNTLKPAIANAGLNLAASAQPHCFSAIQDLGTISSDMGNAVVNFRTNNVDRVMFVSIGEEGTLGYEFMLAAGQQDWYPGYAMSSMSYATTVATQSGVKQQELENARGVGWNPVTDTADLGQAPPNTAARQCLARLSRQGLRPASNNDHFYAYVPCDDFSLLVRILQATNGDISPSAFVRGLGPAQSGFQSALNVDGSATGWDHGRLGPGAYRYFAYNTSKSQFLYTSKSANF